MGDPRKFKNKYESPRKLWDAQRIRQESKLKREYGLKNSREIWVTLNALKRARRDAMKYLSLGQEGEKKAVPLMKKLAKLGIIAPDSKLDDILSLSVEHFLDRRLQTLVFKKGLAKTIKQARQLITHGFISIKGRKVTVPSYLVTSEEEKYISYYKPFDISASEGKAAQEASM
ncbi:MAG: 30S ribosomal protein S4 [Candidatus Micrarchaeota archaeon]|nr:30S ribosomal protein S4 [Candidatus Micrarchaeota archaeon]